ncbi:protein-tyrosine phosphatase-like protein [Mycotypha africana]|uniref:protein-tyrosine phosphatase-like protein n=1 Tax=Mycotypha africana TaxID=64632 RepID=UPI00230064AC|nr:protein-tyrosine phosphatase-like protein [Mycotypha africana]KAI8977319.1 protein-tyrosine phosphatase-like protein [Mycotypha africana]
MKERKRAQFEHKNSSLGIVQALQNDNAVSEGSCTSRNGRRTTSSSRNNNNDNPLRQVRPFRHSTIMTDAMFKTVPTSSPHSSKGHHGRSAKSSNNSNSFYIWARFLVSLYYNKLAVNMFGFWTGWSWYNKIDDYIILGALPTPIQVRALHQHENVETIVNLCAEFPGYQKLYRRLQITQIRLETPDFAIPNLDTLLNGVEKIVEMKKRKPKSMIYLHCKAGRGRSAAMAICYLLRTYLLNLHECQTLLLHKRPQIDTNLEQSHELRLFSKHVIADAESGRITRIPYMMDSKGKGS